MEQLNSNYARFLALLRILVDETRRDTPMTMEDILMRCDECGAHMNDKTFRKYTDYMEEGGILISRKLPEGNEKGPYLYWYETGWI